MYLFRMQIALIIYVNSQHQPEAKSSCVCSMEHCAIMSWCVLCKDASAQADSLPSSHGACLQTCSLFLLYQCRQSTTVLAVFEINALWILCSLNVNPQYLESNMHTCSWVTCVVGSAALVCCRMKDKHTVPLACSHISCFHSVLLPLLRNPFVATEEFLRTEASPKSESPQAYKVYGLQLKEAELSMA